MTPEQIEILKDQLQTDYVPGLPPLVDQNKPTHESAPKNISRAFAAFSIRHICDVDAATASAAVVDDFVDNGLDAIYYHPASKKLFLLQAKLKRDEPFKEGEGDDFGEEITKARNHQNPVAEHHFAALDRNQERLRRELAFYNIIYRYRPEETDPVRRVAVMYIKQAAVALALFDASPAIPVQLKRDTGVFVDPASDHYARVFPATLSGKHLANAVRVFRAASAALDSNEVAASGREKLIYRHGRYAIFWLMIRANPTWATLGHVISYQEAEGLVSKPLDDWRERVRSQAEAELDRLDKGPLAFFRNLTDLRPFLVRLRNEGIQ